MTSAPPAAQTICDGRFEIIGEHSRESSTATMLASDVATGRQVYAKRIRDGLSRTDRAESRDRLGREAEVLRRLSERGCVNVLRFIDTCAGPDGELDWLVTEGPAPTSRSVIENYRYWPLAERLGIVAECFECLSVAHAAGIVHGDLTLGRLDYAYTGPTHPRLKINGWEVAEFVEDVAEWSERDLLGAAEIVYALLTLQPFEQARARPLREALPGAPDAFHDLCDWAVSLRFSPLP